MARSLLDKIEILQNTALRLTHSESYQWGHMGACNCGHLAQEVTELSRQEIHDYAMRSYGDWNEQLSDHCPASGMPFDLIIGEILSKGFSREELMHLERLSDLRVLALLPEERRPLAKNRRDDVVAYLHAWAKLLQQQQLAPLRARQAQYAARTQSELVLA